MKLINLKSYFLLKAVKPGIILLATLLLFGVIYLVESRYIDKYSIFKQKNDALESKLSVLDNNIAKSKSVQETWKKIKDDNFNNIGLRVEEAKKAIDSLSKDYLINNLDVNLSNPVTRKDIFKEKVGLEYSEINISFSTYLDTEVYKFIDGLNKKIPGILDYTYIDIKSLGIDITDALLQGIKQGGYKDLVQVKLSIIWQDFIRKKESSGNGESK